MIKIKSVEKDGYKIKAIIERKVNSTGKGSYNEIKFFDSEKYFKNWVKFNKLKWNLSIR